MASFKIFPRTGAALGVAAALIALAPAPREQGAAASVLSGRRAMGDGTTDAPGVRRKITVADLPPP